MKSIEQIKMEKKFNSLPDGLKYVCKWHQWILYDMGRTGSTETFGEYQNMRLWLVNTLNSIGITHEHLPVISQDNFYKIWFEVEGNLDKESFKLMDHEFYDIKRNRGYYSMVEVKCD